MSGVYHMMVRGGIAHQVMGRLDHSAIFILIAGTFTPIHGLLFRGWRRWAPLVLIWSAALTGIALKTIFYHDLPQWVSHASYLTLGWFGLVSAGLLVSQYGRGVLNLIVAGGLAYSIGAVLDILDWPVLIAGVFHAHEVFHLAVLIGALFHWTFVWRCTTGRYRQKTGNERAIIPPEPFG